MSAEPVDITLLLEGTYPYVRGGVSSWVHQLIASLPEWTFRLVFLGAKRSELGPSSYPVPGNVRDIRTHFLFDPVDVPPRSVAGNPWYLARVKTLHAWFRGPGLEYQRDLLRDVLSRFGKAGGCPLELFLYGENAWEYLCESFSERHGTASFQEFFWTVRALHLPLFRVAAAAESVGPSRVFHTISTGYAGFLGVLLHLRQQRPLLLTEHGIYTKERKIDLEALYLPDESAGFDAPPPLGKPLWVSMFENLGRLSYLCADPIVSLYENNRQRQIRDGAPPERTRVIPNGVDVARFRPLRQRRPARIPPVLGLLGRIVPIKDVKTFIRTMRLVVSRVPEAEGWLIGPTEEDESYADECRSLIKSLGLEGKVRFLGFQKPEEIFPQLGLLVLTSISEAFPLVIIEAWASGLPAVTTDVGACRELLEGAAGADRELGAAGAVFPICDPEAAATAALNLLCDPDAWHRAQAAGIRRVETYFTQEIMIDRYRALYREAMG